MDATGLLNDYHVDFRASADMNETTTVSAYRVEGWSQDYAFFQDASNFTIPTMLIPRSLVRCVRLVRNEVK